MSLWAFRLFVAAGNARLQRGRGLGQRLLQNVALGNRGVIGCWSVLTSTAEEPSFTWGLASNMSQVELTPRAEKSVLDLLGNTERIEKTVLVVEMGKTQNDVHLLLKDNKDFISLQRDLDIVGPFHIPVGDHEMSMFVRDNQPSGGGLYELDYLAVGGKNAYKIRPRQED